MNQSITFPETIIRKLRYFLVEIRKQWDVYIYICIYNITIILSEIPIPNHIKWEVIKIARAMFASSFTLENFLITVVSFLILSLIPYSVFYLSFTILGLGILYKQQQ